MTGDRHNTPWFRLAMVLAAVAFVLLLLDLARRPNLWMTPDQRGDRLMQQKQFTAAAKAYADPFRQGTAWYRAGEFKEAAAAFARVSTAEGAFDHGNALVLLGKYEDAVKSYDRALELRPNWTEADENRTIARLRLERLKKEEGDATGGEMKPDEIVVDKTSGKKEGVDTEVAGGEPLSDEELRTMWLRRVQTKPADFLRAKFAFQSQQQETGK